MAEEIEDNAFYREDFSTESDWEVFQIELRELFQEFDLSGMDWGRDLDDDELFRCDWTLRYESLELLKKKIAVKYYSANLGTSSVTTPLPSTPDQPRPMHMDLMSVRNSFTSTFDRSSVNGPHALARYYGLRRFVLIHPQDQFFTNPAEFSFFVSAANVAATELCSTVPVFVQIFDPKWNYFQGIGIATMLRTNFDVVAIEQAPTDLRYLAGLLAMFREKIGDHYNQPTTVSVRMTYMLETSIRIPGHIPFSKSLATNESNSLSTSQFVALPHGYLPNSRTELYIAYTWREIADNIAFDSILSSDFTPLNSPFGRVYQLTNANSYLTNCLVDYLKLRNSKQTLEEFLGRNFSDVIISSDSPNPLDQLTKSKSLLRTHRNGRNYRLSGDKQPKKISGPMNEFELDQMLLYLFPDIQPDKALWPYGKKIKQQEFDPLRVKSALPDSLVCRLSCLLANCYAHFGGMAGLSQLWATFTRELRLIWDSCIFVPGIAAGFPDTRTCLLHQKLQMLNVCVERRRQREFGIKADAVKSELHASRTVKRDNEDTAANAAALASGNKDGGGNGDGGISGDDDDDDDNEDEFYDCDDELASNNANRPEGRLKALGDLKLLDSDEALYVPVTQDPVPKTEDQLHEDAEAMLKLGPGSGLTTQMMCSSLLSDMEAFKAANPKAKMEDFIRWYSPKDWEEVTDELGSTTFKLSARMTAPDNTWLNVWQQAQPVAAWRQKRLFDDTNEALKVLHYLETRNMAEIYELTIIPIIHSAILKLKDIFNQCNALELFDAQLETLLNELCRLSRDVEIISETETSNITQLPNPTAILKQLETLETQLYQYKCFEHMSGHPSQTKSADIGRKFKESLENGGSCKMATRKQHSTTTTSTSTTPTDTVSIFGSEDGELKLNLRHELHENLISKEYVIRIDDEPNPVKAQLSGPQFLRAIVTGESLRLCSAFTENTTFI